jgi:predicted nucleotidyltransferase component of viral defense system
VLLDAPAPKLRAYPVETVVAEKFHALVTRGITNSRLKDYYDLWLIAKTFELERAALVLAVRQTFARRETALPQDNPTGLSEAYVEAWADQWRTFLSRERVAAVPAQLANVVADLQRYLLPLIDDVKGEWRWIPTQGWIQGTAT